MSTKLYLGNQNMKLIAVDSNLNNGSSYSFPTPYKWRKYTNCNITFHYGRVSILLGGVNFNCYSLNIEEDKRGVTLLKSRLSDQHIIFGSVNLSSITWSQSKNTINVVNIMSVSVVDIQEQLLPTISVEKYLNLSNREKLIQINKYKGIKEILANTTMDTAKNKVSVKYLYNREKLPKIGENFYGATKRASALHTKILPKADVASGMEQYIYEQVENYVEIIPSEACLNKQQLHFVGYNFVVSSNSSSTSKNDCWFFYVYRIQTQLQQGHQTSSWCGFQPRRHSPSMKMSCVLLCVWY